MARRTTGGELEFGSDSFLDIVANIVGILIILIVVAGVRVSQTPPPQAEPDSPAVMAETSAAEVISPEDLQPLLPKFTADPERRQPALPEPLAVVSQATPREPVRPLPVIPPVELVQEAEQLRSQLLELQRQAAQVERAVQGTHEGQQSLEQQRADAQARLQEEQLASVRAAEIISRLEQELEQEQRALADSRVRLAETESAGPAPQILKHELNPVGRTVQGEELHFLLSEQRVAPVPINKLADRLKSELERQRDRLVRMQRYVGSVGPIDGFRMEYVVEQIPSSLLEDLRYGQHVIRVGVTQWQLVPEPDLRGETLEEALRGRSEFMAHLRQAGQRDVVTFWVYPDCFELHRGLQAFAHEQGYDVAARPLPQGIPITGSPNGSRSISQ